MTVAYHNEVAASLSSGFVRLLFKWRGSVYRIIYCELLIYLALFASISLLYHIGLSQEQKKTFDSIACYFEKYTDVIPLTFILGFYVASCTKIFFTQFMTIPLPDRVCYAINATVLGADEQGRLIRRTLVRYVNLMLILGLHDSCLPLKKKYPKLEDLVAAGYMTVTDYDRFKEVVLTTDCYWIPCAWFVDVLRRARLESDRIVDMEGYKLVNEELLDFRDKCGRLRKYAWVTLPLIYTQIVTIATYAYFIACLFARQGVTDQGKTQCTQVRLYFPLFTVLEFVIYVGLLKAAEELLNPFGEGEEDIEIMFLIERNIRVSYLTVDACYDKAPIVHKDVFYGKSDLKVEKELKSEKVLQQDLCYLNESWCESNSDLTSL